ncbi:hypothetical protein GCK32_000858 [Trichostrongylus colubriformis]|uniref:Uncharacterized protein n=1 Tax=Trichostrongylus colubriformis TaxID=6319 RepID=A0AAN8EZL8_TRICO
MLVIYPCFYRYLSNEHYFITMDDSAMDCSAPLSDEGGKGKMLESKVNEEEIQSPGKVTSKTDSQSTEEALDPDAADLSGSNEPPMDPNMAEDVTEEYERTLQCRDVGLYFRPRSESPDLFRSSGRPSNLKSAYDSSTDGQQHNETAPTSPSQRFEHTYEVEDSRDEVRSESGGVRSRGRGTRGRGRGGTRPCSGSATPLANSPLVSNDKKRSGRGRGSKRGRGYGLSRIGDVIETETGSAVTTSTADDVYEFKSSPESEFTTNQPEFGGHEERERSAPPCAKRQRLTDARPESHGGSAHSGDIEMDDIDEDDANSKPGVSDRKVPPLRISLPITQTEEDMHGEQSGHQMSSTHLNSNRKGPRGRHGKRHNDADEAQRMTRSKVRQTGKVLDDTDAWSKKKRGRVNATSLTAQGDEAEESLIDDVSPMAEGSDDTSPTGQASNSMSIPDTLSSEQRIIYENPRSGMFHMKKLLAARWVDDLRKQHKFRGNENEKYKDMLLLTGDYALRRPDGSGTTTRQAGIEKMELKTEQTSLADTNSSSNSVANGEAESEDESNGLCPEMRALWKEHVEERANMMNRMYKERVKLRLFWEQELLRMEQREKGTTPAMSAVRFLRENEMCNAQILEETHEPLKPMNRNEFVERKNKSINQMYNRHRMEASSLFGLQRDMWLCEARRRGIEVSAAVPISHESSPLAPSVEVALAIVHASYPNIIGVYYSNQNYKDKSLNPYAVRLCDSVTSVCGTPAILVQVINWNLSPDCESNSLAAYLKDGENWKETRLDTSSESLTILSRAIHNKLYRTLHDFENHLDRPECDFYNTGLSQKLGQLIG